MLATWFEEHEVARRSEDAWDWLRHDERGRVVGLFLASVAMSVAMSVLATMLVRVIEHRRAAASSAAVEPVDAAEGDDAAAVATAAAEGAEAVPAT